jgi:hypothetical protein
VLAFEEDGRRVHDDRTHTAVRIEVVEAEHEQRGLRGDRDLDLFGELSFHGRGSVTLFQAASLKAAVSAPAGSPTKIFQSELKLYVVRAKALTAVMTITIENVSIDFIVCNPKVC